jgi:hypothetical protein
MDKRAWSHRYRNKWWTSIAAKVGFDVQILARWDDEESAFEHEKLLISCFRDLGYSLVNIADGGQGPSGLRHSEATRAKLSKLINDRMKCPEQRRRISERLKGVSRGRPGKLSEEEIRRRTRSRYLTTPKYTFGDKSLTIKEWSELLGLPNSTIRYRFHVGASPYEKRNKRGEQEVKCPTDLTP